MTSTVAEGAIWSCLRLVLLSSRSSWWQVQVQVQGQGQVQVGTWRRGKVVERGKEAKPVSMSEVTEV